jgi:hypothetical protein
VREGEVSLEFEAIPARRGSYTLEVSNASGFAKSAPRTLEVRLWSTRFLQNSWAGYNFTKDNVTKELDPGTYNFIANSGLDKTFPASVSLDDTLMVSYADGYTYKWYGRNESTPLPVPSGPTLKLTSAIKTYGPNYRLMMTKGAIKVTLVFTFSVGTTKSQDVDAKFVGDPKLPFLEEYFAMEGMPWDFGVAISGAASGSYKFTWYRNDVAIPTAPTSTGFYTIPAEEMLPDLNGIYPAEGTYRVEVTGPDIKGTLKSNNTMLYIFTD